MMIRSKLLEVVVQRIIDRIMNEHLSVMEATVEVAKINSTYRWRCWLCKCGTKREKNIKIENKSVFLLHGTMAEWLGRALQSLYSGSNPLGASKPFLHEGFLIHFNDRSTNHFLFY